eukprot:gene4719-6624_t
MATRNLTKKFLEIRTSHQTNKALAFDGHAEGGRVKLGEDDGQGGFWKGDRNKLPPAWVERLQKIDEEMKQIELKLKELSALHKKRLMVNFESDEAAEERAIADKAQEITNHFHHAEKVLQKFNTFASATNVSSAETSVRNNMKNSFAKRLQGLSISFRTIQKVFLINII